jgi:hypothetical protein
MSAAPNAVARPLARTLLVIGGCAVGLVLARLATRDIHVTGHSALPALFFLVFSASRVHHVGAAGAAALPTAVAAQLGLAGSASGAGTLLALAGLVEAAAFLRPRFAESVARCALVGGLAGLVRFASQAVPLALGVPDTGAPVLASAIGFAAFGSAGAALVPLLDSWRERRKR